METRPVCILLHGALGTGKVFSGLEELLKPEYRVFAPDLPGHGLRSSEPGPQSIENYTLFLQDFLEEHALQDVHVFGHSLGGYVALNHARVFPGKIHRAITFGTKFQWSPETAVNLVKMLNPEKIEVKVPAFAQLLIDRHGLAFWKRTVMSCAHAMTLLGNQPLLNAESVQHITIPVVCAVGTEDDVVSEEETMEMASFIPGGQAMILQGIPHQVEKIAPEKLLELFR